MAQTYFVKTRHYQTIGEGLEAYRSIESLGYKPLGYRVATKQNILSKYGDAPAMVTVQDGQTVPGFHLFYGVRDNA